MDYSNFLVQYNPALNKYVSKKDISYLGSISVNSNSQTAEAERQDEATAETRDQLVHAIVGSYDVLATAKTSMTLFPDTLTIDREKLTVTVRTFVRTSEVMSIRVEDILNATATVGPIFGSVKIISRVMNSDQPYTIGLFWRSDALRMKKIIQGYVIALNNKINCDELPAKELIVMLEMLGEDSHRV